MKRLSSLLLVSLLSGAITLGAYKVLFDRNSPNDSRLSIASDNYTRNVSLGAENMDFTAAAENAVHTVVHVKNVSVSKIPSSPLMEFFYGYRGDQQQTQIGTGSGVIITEDGYIVTNNHVIQNATELEVTLNNNKTYKARLIGTDSKMDIALLKVDADEKLPYATFGNSDNLKVGEWVLAVGNPYNLTSTVTAGIVSAKARNLSNNGIQSFIQTDAAVNPGNSGGALVNTRGELIGINTMISSVTGSYVGYSFAVPSNITRKIIEDLMEYGNVQRGVLGVEGTDLNSAASKEFGVKLTQGFYITNVSKKSGAEKSGLRKGDIIVKLDNQNINSYADLSSYINTKRPNDVVIAGIIRDGDRKDVKIELTKRELLNYEFNGLELEDIGAAEKKMFNINYGVKIKDVTSGNLLKYANDLKGSIILNVDGAKATDIETVSRALARKGEDQSVRLEIITKKGVLVQVITQ
ncbi:MULTISPECIES: trypsin-like peptidase domain-containing protein [unclassified Flavobacterium]|uniref:trypsin-like peptidase domain-containing protein n=1 Tax=unclassified Flavobacterium TaxID=196869 RepID=UPI00095A3205|nr:MULTISPECIES: trypsin-like peptidase domain-containing protein [unclassified Flavobacterium]MBN9283207.1 trypsin-like peptidase domain-containing protein [Flavobacterium sp.]OJV67831.1 MAG: serine protease [Flavobacterium sp. 40-81]